ncbi:MAG: hypothetical protein IT445_09385 [Phycisphaeraceae bacterium]|nr:hypothetical protein [Phycisphaeraceae bacterium]
MPKTRQGKARSAKSSVESAQFVVPRSNASILHVDLENYMDELAGPLNAGVRWLGEPHVQGHFGLTEVTRGFAFSGERALHAETSKPSQRAQIKLAKRYDAPESKGIIVCEFVFRPVRSKLVRISDWVIWRTLSTVSPGPLSPSEEQPVSVELRARGSAPSGAYSVDLVEGHGKTQRTRRSILHGLKQNRWTRFVLLRDPAAGTVRLWAGNPDEEQFIGTFSDRHPQQPVNYVILGDDSSTAIVGSGYWDDIRIGGVLKRKSDLRPAELAPVLRFKSPKPVLPIAVTDARQLFIDDWVIDSVHSIKRTLHPMQKHPANPVIVPDKPWEGAAVLGGGGTLRDENTGQFRIWYKAHHPVYGPPPKYETRIRRSFTCYAVSDNGLEWTKPKLGIVKYQGNKANNIVLAACESNVAVQEMFEPPPTARVIRAMSYVHYVPSEADPQRRYVSLVRMRGFTTFTSSDGIHWTDRGKVFDQAYDATSIQYDPVRHMYYGSAKIWAHGRRARGYSESPDGINWSDTLYQLDIDQRDHPADQMYQLNSWYYETLHLGLLKMYHHEPEHRLDLQLVSARDPRHWDRRYREPVLACGDRASNEWDWANQSLVSSSPVRVGNELWFYYSGRTRDHIQRDHLGQLMPPIGQPWGAIGIARLRLDGFVSADAGSSGGMMETKELSLTRPTLCLNADAARGEVRVELIDLHGRPIPGYTARDAVPLTRDSVSQKIHFRTRRHLPEPGTPVKIRFYLKNASLYSFWTA